MKLRGAPFLLILQALRLRGAQPSSRPLGHLRLVLAALIGMTIQLSAANAGILTKQGSTFLCGDSALGVRTLHLDGDLRTGRTCAAGNGSITSVSHDQAWDRLHSDSVYAPSTATRCRTRWPIASNYTLVHGSASDPAR